MKIFTITTNRVFADMYSVDPETDKLLFASLFSDKDAELNSTTANLELGQAGVIYDTEDIDIDISKLLRENKKKFFGEAGKYNTFFEKLDLCKSFLYKAMIINMDLFEDKGEYFVCLNGNLEDTLFNKLMRKYDLPLLKEWTGYILNRLKEEEKIYQCPVWADADRLAETKGQVSSSSNWQVYRLVLSDNEFKEFISQGLMKKEICISNTEQNELQFENLDEYYTNYGHTAVNNLVDKLKPLTELKGSVDMLTKKKTLYPQQAALVNGLVELLKTSSYGIMNEGMGCGKSFQAASIPEKFTIDKERRKDPKLSLSEAVQKGTYRNLVMCPGHLVEKWKDEIEKEIPLSKATIINDFKQLLKLKKEKGQKPKGKDFYIISKDFCKLSFQKRPTPSKIGKRKVKQVCCEECGEESTLFEYKQNDGKCIHCENELTIKDLGYYETGLICPDCGELVYPNVKRLKLDRQEEDSVHQPLHPIDFANQTSRNSICNNCNSELWTPHLKNVNDGDTFSNWIKKKANPWVRITHYRNKAKKGYKTVWVHKDYTHLYLEMNEIDEGEYSYVKYSGVRKFAPSVFIKKYLGKGFFDVSIFDEAHMYKGGGTAQGHAMHSIIKASKKTLALTGTIAGGVASHLFYLLFRLDPKKLLDRGYKYCDELKFARDYGVVEEVAMFDSQDEAYNSSSRGKKTGSPTVKPGINPLLFSHFLLDKTVFLDLSDLAAYLPELYEDVITVDMTEEMLINYRDIQNNFKKLLRQKGGKKLMATMLQTLLAYPDKPFGMDDIKHPDSGQRIISLPDVDSNTLYPKEEALVERINKELSENRRVFVYAEFTGEGDKNVTYRLKKIIEEQCNLKGQVSILKSSSPQASKRELWLKQQAAKGIKVIISNPRCVETGLDFIFNYEGVTYNYPTLIFYQMGYNLFTLWQASRRHYRLNQKEECRTFYMAYKHTLQEAVINIMAEKKVATGAIQGQFSAEGLAAMAQGVDTRVQLAKALRDSDNRSNSKIEEMFAKINSINNISEISEEDKMFLEMLEKKAKGEGVEVETLIDSGNITESDIVSLFNHMRNFTTAIKDSSDKADDSKPKEESSIDQKIDLFNSFKIIKKEDIKAAKKYNKKVFTGQMSFV